MSLPREPRQKMINMMYLVLTALLALNVSAEILNAFKTVNKSLETTNATVDKSTTTIIQSLKDKLDDPKTHEKAAFWLPKAEQVQSYSTDVYSYIQGLKNDIIKQAGGDPDKNSFKADNLDIATRLMIDKGKGKELLQKLTEYKSDVLQVDPAIDSAFGTTLPIYLEKPKTQSKSNNTWERAYFHMVPTVAALTILSKFQNDVKTSENKIVQFCHNKVGEVVVRYDTYTAFAATNSSYVMPGDEMEITAGVGAFSKAALPEILIEGTPEQLTEDGAAHRKIKAAATLGKHTVLVNIKYTDQEGNLQTIPKTIEYTVGQSAASIALDKMNVLYIGVDNPISIAASGGGDDKVSAIITGGGGTIKRLGGGKWVARVTQQSDDCRITVSVDGKAAGASVFRVRRIPSAVATVGAFESGENIPAGTFRAQGGVAAWIKDFPFDLKYRVTQFTLSTDSDDGDIVEAQCTGNAFDSKAIQLIRDNVKPGKTVYIDNIRAIGEDGENRKVPSLVYYIK
jgi:gliding motility-associated protein GldM